MRKILALLLASIAVFAMTACAKDTPSESTPATSANTQDTPQVSGGLVGYITDEVDYQARKTYEIAFIYHEAFQMCHDLFTAMQGFEKKLNIHVTEYAGDGDNDRYISNLEIIGMTKPDGIVCIIDATITNRVYEILQDIDIPYIALWNGITNGAGATIAPVVMIDDIVNGESQVQFLHDSFEKYWGSVDPSKIALLTLEFSASPELANRSQGSKNRFKELYPNNVSYVADLITTGFGAEQALNQTVAVMSAHPEVEYWFIAGVVDEFGQGAVRAAESLGKESKVLIVSSGANVIKQEWDNGYDGCWIGAFAVSDYAWVAPPLCGVIALIDGRATPETLWAERRAPGDVCTRYKLGGGNDILTKENYKTILEDVKKEMGI